MNNYINTIETHILKNVPHDSDFYFFKLLNGQEGLFLDIGGNVGQSAISLFSVNDTMNVLSLEPNRELSPALKVVANNFPGRFTFLLKGAAEQNRDGDLYIPNIDGIDFSPRASLQFSEFQKGYIKRNMALEMKSAGVRGNYILEKSRVELVTVDSLHIVPTVIKIDVEGYERAVLTGGQDTISIYRPILLIEINNIATYADLLDSWGYDSFTYKVDSRQLEQVVATDHIDGILNHFWIHRDKRSELSSLVGFNPFIQYRPTR